MVDRKADSVDSRVKQALAKDLTIDITTRGRRSGEPRRVEIWFRNLKGRLYITGLPGTRGWYANLLADPRFIFHLKMSAQADLPARAIPITDPVERRRILAQIKPELGAGRELEAWVKGSPLVEVDLLEG